MIKVLATVKMQGVAAGQTVQVDQEDPHIAKLIARGFLVPEPSASAPKERGREE